MKKTIFAFLFLVAVTCFFFYQIFRGFIPFPGDLLIGNDAPYNAYSYHGYQPGGFPNKAQDFDVAELLYPGKEFIISSLQHGQFPLWNPYILSGQPQFAALQAGTLYPLNIVFFIFPFLFSWTLFIFLGPLLAAFFTYLFLRKLKLSELSSLLGTIAFSFSSYMLVWLEYGNMDHTVIWLPLVLYLVLQFIENPRLLTGLFLTLILTCSILAGYIQTTFFLFLFAGLFALFVILSSTVKQKTKILLSLIPFFVLPVFLAAIQLIPTLELLLRSARSEYTHAAFVQLLIPNFHLLSFFAPDFFGNPVTRNYWVNGTYIERVTYIGIIPIFFILYSFFSKKTKWFYFFLISSVVVLLLTVDTPISRTLYSIQIPFLATAVPTRMLFLFSFCASILASLGFEQFTQSKNKKTGIFASGVLFLIFISIWMGIFIVPHITSADWIANLAISKHNLIIPTGLVLLTIVCFVVTSFIKQKRRYVLVIFLVITICELFYSFQKLTPFVPKDTVYPKTPVVTQLSKIQGIDRFWGYGAAYIQPNIGTIDKTFTTDGYDALHDKQYGELISASKNGKIQNPLPRSDVNLAPGFGNEDLKMNPYRQRILNLLGVKYIINRIDPKTPPMTPDTLTFPSDRYSLVWQNGPYQIYQNKHALPRVFLAGNYKVERGNKIIGLLFNPAINLKKTLILEQPIKGFDVADDPKKSAKLLTYSSNDIIITTSAKTNTLLFLSDTYFPGWNAYVDGVKTAIFRADYAFRAVPVKKGNHTVELRYEPESFESGKDISLTALFVVIVLLGFSVYRRNTYEKNK